MAIKTATIAHRPRTETISTRPVTQESTMLLREALGMTLRAFRADKAITLRDLAEKANVSPGYLSELERGRKEVSSELLASICHALGATVSDVLFDAATTMTMSTAVDELAASAGVVTS